MNINKIREALEMAEAMADVFDQLSQKLGDLRERNADRSRLEEIREALAELDKAPNVLTDEEIERVANTQFTHATSYSVYVQRESWKIALRHARDNGYLSPAAGLTVDVAEIVQIAAVCAGEAWSGYAPLGQVVGSPFRKFRNDFRARLTAAIEAKTNSK